MIAQRIWALIDQESVRNVIVCDSYPMADMLAKQTLSKEAIAIEVTQIPTTLGDGYKDGFFYDKQGNKINPLPTVEEEAIYIKQENTELKTANEKLKSDLDNAILELTTAISMGGSA